MDELHIGHIEDENYSLFGKLSDGTPVYKHTPPSPPDPNILREQQLQKKKIIDDYNISVELNQSDTSELLELFTEEELKEQALENKQKSIRRNKTKSSRPISEDKHNVLDYLKPSNNKGDTTPSTDDNTTDYLELFETQEKQEQDKLEKENKIKEEKERLLLEENERIEKSANKYREFLQSIKDEELEKVKEFEDLIQLREQELQTEYDSLLIDDPIVEFYAEDVEYKLNTDVKARAVTVTNTSTGAERIFNYLGTLETVDLKGYKLTLYSIVRGDKDYGIIKESYKFLTHRHMVYDLRTGEVIKRETYVISKVDPASIDETDPEVYAEGWTNRTISLSSIEQPHLLRSTPIKDGTLSLDGTLEVDLDGQRTSIIPTELVVQCYGAGGAGLSGVDSGGQGAGGGGGAFAQKTFSVSPLQTYPVSLRYNVGSGHAAPNRAAVNSSSGWDNEIVKPDKDTFFIFENYHNDSTGTVQTLSTIAAGGYDGDLNPYYAETSDLPGEDAGFPGRPLGDYDIGFWGSGNKPWSTMKYHLSTVDGVTESKWNTIITGTQNYGVAHNGALSGAHGAGSNNVNVASTLNIGMSSGQTATSSNISTSGFAPAGAGGGSGYGNEINTQYVEDPPGSGNYVEQFVSYVNYTSGSPGGNGLIKISVTKGIVNREAFS